LGFAENRSDEVEHLEVGICGLGREVSGRSKFANDLLDEKMEAVRNLVPGCEENSSLGWKRLRKKEMRNLSQVSENKH
jgi:hypothetical protein